MLSYIFPSIKWVSLRRESQYLVSKHSLYDMDSFAEKSALEIPPFASAIFAPMLVPLF
ncbi:MAG: hypothetical protein RIB15_09515 [Gracilimonas sp.]